MALPCIARTDPIICILFIGGTHWKMIPARLEAWEYLKMNMSTRAKPANRLVILQVSDLRH